MSIDYENFHIKTKNGKNNVNKIKKSINEVDKNCAWYFAKSSDKLG